MLGCFCLPLRKSLTKGHSAAKLTAVIVLPWWQPTNVKRLADGAQNFPHFPWHDCGCRAHSPGDAATRRLCRLNVKRFADDAQNFPHFPGRDRRCRAHAPCNAATHRLRRIERKSGSPRTPTSSSICSATCSSGCAPITSKSPTTTNSSNRRSTACSPGSIRIRATWIQIASATFRCRPAASSAASAWKSPWKTGW